MCNLASLSLKLSIKCFFFPFLFSSLFFFVFVLFFCFFVFLFVLMLPVLLPATVVSLCSFLCISRVFVLIHQRNLQCWWDYYFFDTYNLLFHLLNVRLCVVLLILFSFGINLRIIDFKNGLEYLTRLSTQMFILWMRFLQQGLVFRSFLVLLRYSFFILFYLCLFGARF